MAQLYTLASIKVLKLDHFRLSISDLNGVEFCHLIAQIFPAINELYIYISDSDYGVCSLDLNLNTFAYVPKRYIRCSHGEKDIFP